jgi:hypothetical protein
MAKERDSNGRLQADPIRFPRGIKFLADYVSSTSRSTDHEYQINRRFFLIILIKSNAFQQQQMVMKIFVTLKKIMNKIFRCKFVITNCEDCHDSFVSTY